MQINDNQTNKKDPDNRGQEESAELQSELNSLWLG